MQNIFGQGREILVNYDWIDVADSTGFVEYEAWVAMGSYKLIRTTFSNRLFSCISMSGATKVSLTVSTTTNTESYVKILDQDFDLESFKLPRNIKGDVYINLSYASMASTSSYDTKITAKIRKWNGSVETEIADDSTLDLQEAGDGNQQHADLSLKVTVPLTRFKVGEQLRLTIEGYAKLVAGQPVQNIQMAIAGDPADGTATSGGLTLSSGNTRIILIVPYKLEI